MKRRLAALEASFTKPVPDDAWQWETGTGGLESSSPVGTLPLHCPALTPVHPAGGSGQQLE